MARGVCELLVVCLLVGAAAPARAQSTSLPPPPIEELGGGLAAGPDWVSLRLAHVRERRREGAALLSLGVAGALGGALVAVVGREDPTLLAFGLTTLSFGVINVPLGVGLLDLRQRARREALELTGATADTVAERVAAWARSERWKRVSFAVNAGLDVVYIVAGALLVGLAGRTQHAGSARGAGWGMISQGAALLVYDLYGVRATTRRLRALSTDAWVEQQLLY